MNTNMELQVQTKAAGMRGVHFRVADPESDKAVVRAIYQLFCERVKIGNGNGYAKRS